MNYQSGNEQASVAGAAVRLRDVTMRYTRGKEEIRIFDGLDLDIPSGDFAAIMGPSGSGKTSLLNLLSGLDLPARGTVSVGDEEITALSEGKRARWRAAHIGLVFQFYNLMPVLSAAENVELPLLLTKLPKKRRRENVNAALDLVGLADRGRHKPAELSGGQQQRVAIARAIVSDPDIILADEPTGDLDRASAEEILGILATLNRELNKTIVMVTHDSSAAAHARRTLHLEKGIFRLGEGGNE